MDLTAPVDPDLTVEQMRVHRFQRMTATEYQRLLKLILHQLTGSLATYAEDAFAHACCAATKHYTGQVKIEVYILRVAQNWAISQWRKRRSEYSFTELELSNQQPAEQVPATATPDPQFQTFAEKLSEALAWHATQSNHASTIRRATRAQAILAEFVASAQLDLGLGVDEYADGDTRRTLMLRIAVEVTNGGVAEARKTMTFLRTIAAQVKAMYPELMEH